MPWRPLPRIAFAVAIFPFQPSSPADLPLELGDELYIIEQGGAHGSWYRGYLVAPPSLLAGLTSVKGQTLEARVFSGIFPRNCVEIREYLGDTESRKALENGDGTRVNGIKGTQDEALERVANQGQDVSGIFEPDGKQHRRSESATTYRSNSVPLTPSSITARPTGAKPAAPVPMLKIGDETPTSYEEPLVDEIASCLREWHSTNLHELLLTRQYGVVDTMYNVVLDLDLARRQLLHDVLTSKEKAAVRQTTVWNLVRGNKMLTGETIVRDPQQNGRLLTGDDSAIELTKLQSEMSMFDEDPRQQGDLTSLRHLLLEIKTIAGSHAGPVTLSFYLSTKLDNGTLKPLSETYVLEIQSADSFMALAHTSRLKTLFTELCASDVGDGSGAETHLYLVVMVQSAELPRPSLSYATRTSASRDGGMARSPSNMHSVKGSVKARRSMVWANKAPRPGQPETIKENPPRSVDSTNSQAQVENKSLKDATVIRTVGAGILDVAHIVRQTFEAEHVINIWSPLDEDSEEVGNDNEGFDELIRSVLPSSSGRYSRCYQASQLQLHFYPFIDSDADTLVRNNPTLMHNVTQTRRMGFAAAPSQARSDIYLTISRARFPWPALLCHPQAGQVPVPVNTSFRNLQLTLEARNASGARLDRCIFASSNSTGHTAWRTTVTDRNASWDQTIRLNIPTEQVPGAHVIMSIADAPEFPFALCWLPLWNNQAFIHDGCHSLLLHAYDKLTSSVDEEGRGAYLGLPWSSLHKNSSVPDESVTGPLSTVLVETNLCSTEYSQDHIILGLVSWKKKSGNEVLELLRRVLFVPQIEIVKQLRDVFDALFGILVENAGSEEHEDLIFNALVTVLGIIHDRRYNIGPLVDNYIENQFNFPFATPCLIRSFLRLLQSHDTPQQSRNLRAALKIGRYILKFIISARKQQKLKEEGIGVTKVQPTFNRDLHAIFKCLEALMKNQSPVLVGTKTLVVQHFHTWLPELKDVLPKDELIMISLSFMDSCKEVKGMLILYKLILIQSYTKLDIFASEDDRDTLISCCSGWLDPYWGKTGDVTDQYRDQVRLCASIVAQFSQNPNPQLYSFMRKITSSYCAIALEGVEETSYLSMLYSKAFPFQVKASDRKQKFDEALIELAGLIAAISNIPNPKLPVLKLDDTASFILDSLETHKSIIGCEAYPENWLSLHIYHHRAAVKNLENLASMLTRSFLPPPEEADNFDMKLWELFFATLLKIVSSDALTLETFPEQKRRAVWKIGGDVREQGAALLRNAWEAIGWEIGEDEKAKYGLNKLGGYQVQYVPSLIPGIIELCLSVHEGLRRVAVQILQTMIISEWDLNQDLSIIEMEIVTSLDMLFQNKHMNESITQKLFISELLDLFEPIEKSDEALAADVKGLIATIDELLELLVACSSGGITESLHTLRLMEFMKDMDREDIFIRYVHELAQTQATEQNYTQAGLALQFHADLYTWDSSRLVPALTNPAYPEQSAFERKEALYFKIIQYFEDGKAWTHALACYKELIEQYEHIIMDFAKLSRAQGSMAKIYDTIAKEEKAFPRYFRVSYRGLGFPTTLRDKQFIFEAFPNERMASFTDRIQKLHPAAHIASPSETEDIEGQFLQISAVSPHKEILHPVYQRSKVPHSVREHLLISMPLQFSYTSKRHTSGVDVKEQWVEKTVLTTAEPFPNILRRSEIVSTEILELTPLQTAIERTWRKTQELHLLAQHVISGDDSTLTGLTEALVQLLDLEAPHSSCVAVYRVFLANAKEDEDHESPEREEEEDAETEQKPIDPLENALAVALIDHALSIKRCLSLYSRPSHQATQAELLARFEDVFGPEIASLAAHAQTTTPPQSANQSSDRSTPLANGHGSELAARSFSPEQELIRTSRSDSQRKHSAKPSLSHRISIANPFKRSNHNASSSVATVHQSSDLRQSSDINTGQQSSNGRDREENDDDAVTVHSHATSRGGKSEKRRSWFGGDAKAKHKATNSIAGHGSEEQVDQQGRNRSRARSTATSKSAKSHDASSHSRSRHNRLESKKSTPVLASGGWDSAPTALPRTSQSDPRPDSSDRFAYSDKQPSSTVTITAGRSNGHGSSQSPSANAVPSASTGSVRESVKKRFSLLKGMNKKSSRLNVREDGGDILAESLRED